MGKQETIDRLKPLYLKGKSEEAIEKFESKPLDRQYSSLMSWSYRNRRQEAEESRGAEIGDAIENVRAAIRSARGAAPEDFLRYRQGVESLIGELEAAAGKAREAMIASLERQQSEIEAKLASLRGK